MKRVSALFSALNGAALTLLAFVSLLSLSVHATDVDYRLPKSVTVNSNGQRNSYIKRLFCRGLFDEAAKKNIYA